MFSCYEPGRQVVNLVSRLSSDRTIPVPVVNRTKETGKILRHRSSAKLENDSCKVTEVYTNLKGPNVGDHKTLGHIKTDQMKINTGNCSQIKICLYWAPINKRQVIDKYVDEMPEAGILSRSRSPLSFPVLIIDKKDGTKRFCLNS